MAGTPAPGATEPGSTRTRLPLLAGTVVALGAAVVAWAALRISAAHPGFTVGTVLAAVVLAGLVAALVAWVAVDRVLRRVGVLERRFRDLADGDPRLRVDEPGGDDELARLARTLNDALDRRQRAAEHRLDFVGDAADALRGPLAAVPADLAAAARPGGPDSAHAVQRGLAATDRLQTVAADVLLLARLRAGDRPRREILPWFEVMTDVRAPARAAFSVEGDLATLVLGAHSHLTVLMQYLLDEAARHAETAVVLRIATFDDAVVLRVDDDGPPIPAAERARAFAPFEDPERLRADGSGLALVIVDEIVRAHGGSVCIEESPRGGSRLRVEFPAVRGDVLPNWESPVPDPR
ncbi:HAMP domain-containing sensor histidine kinase [Tsukamurella ocularis]|uniref:HAMP domain-containing sensor histidine kinase n=1 Tax=Tsukamurella ocularis TaxID=1970234 RepID=UPI0021692733|nr:HAMP domain-containing sensor histidine kinase [Tsukamurella ocularis]MCS3780301.1 signal transduction histidine kinase [Tsukamurella ocularis]MCS3786144.1 signal transduction histidine kinase [Tsukamurella ocularis]